MKRSFAGTLLALVMVVGLIQPAGAAAVRLSVKDSKVSEGNMVSVAVVLSRKSTRKITVSYVTLNGTAKAGKDYTAKSGTLTFLPGTIKKVVKVATKEDALDEANETFFVKLRNPTRATILRAKAKAIITDDDALPIVSIANNSAMESDDFPVPIEFTVSLSAPSGRTVKVDVAWGEDTAFLGIDYDASTQTLTFAPGVTQGTATAEILPDDLDEGEETFLAVLDNPVNAAVSDPIAAGTILDDDAPPTPGSLVINEVDYDQLSTDTGEFVELYNPGGLPYSTTNIALVFINGSTSAEYLRFDLSSVGSLAAGDRWVVASSTVTVAGGTDQTFALAQDNIQNGGPDGLALIDTSSCTVIDAISYEGAIAAANVNGCAAGAVSLVEGTPTSTPDDPNVSGQGSLIRSPDGVDSNNAATDWVFTSTLTPGAANTP
jgi:hypothetical protein